MATLKDFMESTFCNDSTQIRAISNYKHGTKIIKTGRRFESVIKKLSNREITYMEWVEGCVEIILAD